ncbi:hypothetical protein B0H13DRAFT_1873853 [Mycena leptocephala]|nr:hypothetical protein B0H13DRAFT_1873853 [Mycena leptocephala]
MMQEISCTVAVAAETDSQPVTHLVRPIYIMEPFLAKREGVLSVTAPTLVNLVRTVINESRLPVPPLVVLALQSTMAVQIATTRVPFFEMDWKATSYGFRPLLPLIPAAAELELPEDNLHSEIFAIDPSHPKTAAYARIWELLIKPEKHFVLALWAPPTSLMPSIPGSHLPVLSPNPLLRIPSPAPSFGISSGHSQYSFPPSQAVSEHPHSPIPDVPPTNFGDFLLASTSFLEACRILGLQETDIARAKFKTTGAAKQLVAMVQTGLQQPMLSRNSVFRPTAQHTASLVDSRSNWLQFWARLDGQSTLSAKKSTSWPTAEPPAEGASDYDLYLTWRAIWFIWQPGGPAQTGQIPSKTSRDPVERAAAALTQTKIESERVKLTCLLIETAIST